MSIAFSQAAAYLDNVGRPIHDHRRNLAARPGRDFGAVGRGVLGFFALKLERERLLPTEFPTESLLSRETSTETR